MMGHPVGTGRRKPARSDRAKQRAHFDPPHRGGPKRVGSRVLIGRRLLLGNPPALALEGRSPMGPTPRTGTL